VSYPIAASAAADVMKAIALGAKSVVTSRTIICRLSFAGQLGLNRVVKCVLANLNE
jgi:isopentenyl diphosphate isomerase/L-lactate dehydrogenase-like FMN-dependent dehydrogenase